MRGSTGEIGAEADSEADAVIVFFDKIIPAVTDGEGLFSRVWDVHAENYNPGILSVKRKSSYCPQS